MLVALGRTLRGEADAPAVLSDRQRGLSGARQDNHARARRSFWSVGQYILRTGSPAATGAVALVGTALCSNLKLAACWPVAMARWPPHERRPRTRQQCAAQETLLTHRLRKALTRSWM